MSYSLETIDGIILFWVTNENSAFDLRFEWNRSTKKAAFGRLFVEEYENESQRSD